MNTHLTFQQISEWVLGDRSREAELHLRSCSSCQAELSRWEGSLKGFRSSVRQWSAEQLPSFPPPVKRNPARPWMMGLGWATAVLVLCIFVVRLSYHRSASSPQIAIADAALLAQVDHEVSRTVPDSMQPLTQLVSWDADSYPATSAILPSESQPQ